MTAERQGDRVTATDATRVAMDRRRHSRDLIAFNRRHCPTEMKDFGQELFISRRRRAAASPIRSTSTLVRIRSNRRARTGSTRHSRPTISMRSSRRVTASRRRRRRLPDTRTSPFRSDSRSEGNRQESGCTAGSCASRACWRSPMTSNRNSSPSPIGDARRVTARTAGCRDLRQPPASANWRQGAPASPYRHRQAVQVLTNSRRHLRAPEEASADFPRAGGIDIGLG